MTTQIRTLRENVVKALSGIKEDNISIAGIAIHRKTLLEALKLQTEDRVTIQYGKLSWDDSGFGQYNADKTKWYENVFEPEQAIQITCGRSVMRFLSRPHVPRKNGNADPQVLALGFIDHRTEATKEISGIQFDTGELLDALTYVMPCVATDEFRKVLECVCFDSKDGVLTLATADGYRLGLARITVKGLPDMRVLVHKEDCKRLLTFLKNVPSERVKKVKYYAECYMTKDDKSITFAIREPGIRNKPVELPLQVGNFPDYAQLIPQAGTQIEFIASDFLEAVKALAPYSKDGSGIIRMEFTRDELLGRVRLSARSEELGESSTEVDANVSGDARIAANFKYLEDAIRLHGDNTISMRLTHPSSPMVFESADKTRTTVVMPMFVDFTPRPVREEEPEDEEEVTEPYAGDEDGQDAEDLEPSESY